MTDLLPRIERNEPVEAQEILDFVAERLVEQGRPAFSKKLKSCQYRQKSGKTTLKCAVGHLMPDSIYKPWMDDPDNGGGGIITIEDYLPQCLQRHRNMLDRVQRIHDAYASETTTKATRKRWLERVKMEVGDLATAYGLKTPPAFAA
jgi:hypothetical protein